MYSLWTYNAREIYAQTGRPTDEPTNDQLTEYNSDQSPSSLIDVHKLAKLSTSFRKQLLHLVESISAILFYETKILK